jgi:uncharacterized membrane protein YfcA
MRAERDGVAPAPRKNKESRLETPLAHILLLWVILCAAYFIRAISGFGSGLIAVPLLVQFLPFRTVIPLMLLLDFAASALMTRITWGRADTAELKRLLPFGALGVAAGAYLLVALPRGQLLVGLGLLVLAFGLKSLLDLGSPRPIAPAWSAPAGLAGGALSALFGTGGPPYAIYLSHRIRDKSVFRATFSLLFLVEGGFRIAAFLVSGLLLNREVWLLAPLAGTALAVGLWRGNRAHLGISSRAMARLIGALLLVSGGSLLVRGIAVP